MEQSESMIESVYDEDESYGYDTDFEEEDTEAVLPMGRVAGESGAAAAGAGATGRGLAAATAGAAAMMLGHDDDDDEEDDEYGHDSDHVYSLRVDDSDDPYAGTGGAGGGMPPPSSTVSGYGTVSSMAPSSVGGGVGRRSTGDDDEEGDAVHPFLEEDVEDVLDESHAQVDSNSSSVLGASLAGREGAQLDRSSVHIDESVRELSHSSSSSALTGPLPPISPRMGTGGGLGLSREEALKTASAAHEMRGEVFRYGADEDGDDMDGAGLQPHSAAYDESLGHADSNEYSADTHETDDDGDDIGARASAGVAASRDVDPFAQTEPRPVRATTAVSASLPGQLTLRTMAREEMGNIRTIADLGGPSMGSDDAVDGARSDDGSDMARADPDAGQAAAAHSQSYQRDEDDGISPLETGSDRAYSSPPNTAVAAEGAEPASDAEAEHGDGDGGGEGDGDGDGDEDDGYGSDEFEDEESRSTGPQELAKPSAIQHSQTQALNQQQQQPTRQSESEQRGQRRLKQDADRGDDDGDNEVDVRSVSEDSSLMIESQRHFKQLGFGATAVSPDRGVALGGEDDEDRDESYAEHKGGDRQRRPRPSAARAGRGDHDNNVVFDGSAKRMWSKVYRRPRSGDTTDAAAAESKQQQQQQQHQQAGVSAVGGMSSMDSLIVALTLLKDELGRQQQSPLSQPLPQQTQLPRRTRPPPQGRVANEHVAADNRPFAPRQYIPSHVAVAATRPRTIRHRVQQSMDQQWNLSTGTEPPAFTAARTAASRLYHQQKSPAFSPMQSEGGAKQPPQQQQHRPPWVSSEDELLCLDTYNSFIASLSKAAREVCASVGSVAELRMHRALAECMMGLLSHPDTVEDIKQVTLARYSRDAQKFNDMDAARLREEELLRQQRTGMLDPATFPPEMPPVSAILDPTGLYSAATTDMYKGPMRASTAVDSSGVTATTTSTGDGDETEEDSAEDGFVNTSERSRGQERDLGSSVEVSQGDGVEISREVAYADESEQRRSSRRSSQRDRDLQQLRRRGVGGAATRRTSYARTDEADPEAEDVTLHGTGRSSMSQSTFNARVRQQVSPRTARAHERERLRRSAAGRAQARRASNSGSSRGRYGGTGGSSNGSSSTSSRSGLGAGASGRTRTTGPWMGSRGVQLEDYDSVRSSPHSRTYNPRSQQQHARPQHRRRQSA